MIRRIAAVVYRVLAGTRRIKRVRGIDGYRLLQVRSLLPRAWRRKPGRLRWGATVFLIGDDALDPHLAASVAVVDHDVYFPELGFDHADVRLVVDVGAHRGFYAVAAAFEYPGAHILAIEPSLDAAAWTRRQIDANQLGSRISVLPVAVGADVSRQTLQHDGGGSWGNTLFQPEQVTKTEDVVVVPLSALLPGPVDVLKCNAEGAEFGVVEELNSSGVRPRVMFVAVHPEFGDVTQLAATISSMGYSYVDRSRDPSHPFWKCQLSSSATSARQRLSARTS